MPAETATPRIDHPDGPTHWVAPRKPGLPPIAYPVTPHGNPPHGNVVRMSSHNPQPPAAISHHRVGGQRRKLHTRRAYAAAVAANQMVSGIQATMPTMRT